MENKLVLRINIYGNNSLIEMNNLTMKSDKYIMIDDINSKFKLEGSISELITDNLNIIGSDINGSYKQVNGENEIVTLIVKSDKLTEITTDKLQMFSAEAIFSKE